MENHRGSGRKEEREGGKTRGTYERKRGRKGRGHRREGKMEGDTKKTLLFPNQKTTTQFLYYTQFS